MPLQVSRAKLMSALETSDQITVQIMPLVENWWTEYKLWEEQDRFLTAFKEARMTIRQCDASYTYDDNFGAGNVNVGSGSRDKYPGQKYAVGMDSLKQRLDPKNFAGRKKYELGLHDMSGSLLDPEKPLITEQLRWKDDLSPGAKLSTWISVFMPMAKPADMVLFYVVNELAKQVRQESPQIYGTVLAMRRSMSRIKLAAAEDIGAGLSDISPTPNFERPKFRYGIKMAAGQNPMAVPANVERQKLAWKYTQLVTLQREKQNASNEVVIAFREHAGDRFPLYTKWVPAEQAPAEQAPALKPSGGSGGAPLPPPLPGKGKSPDAIKREKRQEEGRFVCLNEFSSKYIIGGAIPNKWSETREMN